MSFRDKVLNCLGEMPSNVELQPATICSTDKGDYIQQLVEYSVEKSERIRAYLLIPKGFSNKRPAIVASHQHAGEFYLGKSEPAGLSKNSMYHYGLELCLRGYVVLCPDHLGFEDRRLPEFERFENSNLNADMYERYLFCKYILNGSTLQAKYLSDLSRGIDFLESLNFVNSNNIGAIGHSLGGQETLWLSWFDPRVKAAVSSCGFGQIKSILREGINHNFAMFTFGFLNIGDISDIVCDMAPKPFLMISGTKDGLFPLDGIEEISEKASEQYKKLNAKENYRSYIFEGDHSFPPEAKVEAYTWLDKFLDDKDT